MIGCEGSHDTCRLWRITWRAVKDHMMSHEGSHDRLYPLRRTLPAWDHRIVEYWAWCGRGTRWWSTVSSWHDDEGWWPPGRVGGQVDELCLSSHWQWCGGGLPGSYGGEGCRYEWLCPSSRAPWPRTPARTEVCHWMTSMQAGKNIVDYSLFTMTWHLTFLQ